MTQGVKLNHVAISTPDLDRAVAFYCDVLGAEVESSFDWEPGNNDVDRIVGLADSAARSVMVAIGEAHLELFEYRLPAGRPSDPDRPQSDHGIIHLSLEVDDIHSMYQRLVEAGMRFHSEPVLFEGVAWSVYGRDMDGNVIELQQELPQ